MDDRSGGESSSSLGNEEFGAGYLLVTDQVIPKVVRGVLIDASTVEVKDVSSCPRIKGSDCVGGY